MVALVSTAEACLVEMPGPPPRRGALPVVAVPVAAMAAARDAEWESFRRTWQLPRLSEAYCLPWKNYVWWAAPEARARLLRRLRRCWASPGLAAGDMRLDARDAGRTWEQVFAAVMDD
jgi:hypothetical protein